MMATLTQGIRDKIKLSQTNRKSEMINQGLRATFQTLVVEPEQQNSSTEDIKKRAQVGKKSQRLMNAVSHKLRGMTAISRVNVK